MDPLAAWAFRAHFANLPDPRGDRCKRHPLLDVVTIALCAVICGADSWVEVEQFGTAKQAWLRTFLALPHGTPAHDTCGRVFAALDPTAFRGSVPRLGAVPGNRDGRTGGGDRWQDAAPQP